MLCWFFRFMISSAADSGSPGNRWARRHVTHCGLQAIPSELPYHRHTPEIRSRQMAASPGTTLSLDSPARHSYAAAKSWFSNPHGAGCGGVPRHRRGGPVLSLDAGGAAARIRPSHDSIHPGGRTMGNAMGGSHPESFGRRSRTSHRRRKIRHPFPGRLSRCPPPRGRRDPAPQRILAPATVIVGADLAIRPFSSVTDTPAGAFYWWSRKIGRLGLKPSVS